jgi:DNA-binding phage protein
MASFLQGLRDVVEAQGGMTRAARLAGLNRESLYRQLSRHGNPSLASLNAVLGRPGPQAALRRWLTQVVYEVGNG